MINAQRIARDVVVIGASAGGVGPIKELLTQLPPDFASTVAIVIHRSPFYETRLPWVLGVRALLPVLEPEDADPVQAGAVYVAPRDQHMMFEDGIVRVSRGAKEHRTRPSIDPLFRSAAAVYGRRVVGVLLSGLGADGVSGLITIKQAGGLSLVQDPSEAQFPTMPRAAICEDDVDGIVSIRDLAAILPALARGEPVATAPIGGAAIFPAESA